MTDKEKLLGGIKLIQSACHNSPFIVEDFLDEDFTELKKQYSSLHASRVSFMIAKFARKFLLSRGRAAWNLALLITKRSWVRIPPAAILSFIYR